MDYALIKDNILLQVTRISERKVIVYDYKSTKAYQLTTEDVNKLIEKGYKVIS